MLRLLVILITMVTIAGCKDTGGGVVGYVNSTLNRSVLSTAALSISVNEGSSHSLLIVLDHGVSRATTLDWQINAPNGQFAALGGSVSLSEGQSSALITVESLDNNISDGHRDFIMTISGSTLVFANSIELQVSVIDNESAPLLQVADVSIAEGNGSGTTPAVFTVVASNPSVNNVIINYTTQDGTAVDGTDYNAVSGTLVIPAGSLTGTITVPVIRDNVYETNRNFSLVLSGGTGYTAAGSRLTAVGTIEDDESQSTLAISNINVTEGSGGTSTNAVFTVTMATVSANNVTFNYATSNGTAIAGTDYTATTGTGTILAGATSTTITVPVLHDALYEGSETFTVTLSGGSGYLVSGSTLSAIATILNDDAAPTLAIANVSMSEGNASIANMTFTVTASAESALPITFNYNTSNGTAISGDDYSSTSGSKTISAGTTSTTFTIPVIGNTVYEPSKVFNVTLSGGSGYTVAGSTLAATGTITNDDIAPTISISNITVTEGSNSGSTNAVFTITASSISGYDINVDYATSDGTALAGSDYTATSGTATILAGQTTATVSVSIARDSLYEPTESLNLNLSGGSGYSVAGSILNAIANITDDDIAPTISIANISLAEGTGASTSNATFTVSLATASGKSLSVNYATTNGTAVAGSDYTTTTGTLTIAAGSTTGTFTVPVTQDSTHEADETFTITLSGGSGYTSAGSTLSASATIQDDDAAPTISISNASLTEGNSGSSNMTFTVTASAVSETNISFNFATSDGTALSTFDYTATTGSKTIAAGSTSTTLTVPVIGNTTYEANKTFTVTLSGGGEYTSSGSTLSATGTITNDDTAPTISVGDISVVEGSGAGTTNAIFTVTANAVSGLNITFTYATANGTALAGADYTATSGTGTITAGQTSTTVTVPVTKDSAYEAAETFTLTLSAGAGYTVSGSNLSATATITNDDANTKIWDFQTLADYTLGSNLNFAAGAVTLKQVDVIHNSSAEFNAGTLQGVTYSGSVLKLDTTTANDMSYASAWTPKYGRLVGYWKFDNDWSDSSPSGITLAHSPGATVTNSPVIKSGSNAGVFSVNNWAQATLPATYTSYAISVWAQPMSLAANGPILAQATSGDPALIMNSGNYWTFGNITSTVKAVTGSWTHLVVVQSGSDQYLYVNGILAGTATGTSSLSVLDVARAAATTMSVWVDELGVFSAPLTAADVSVIYNRQKSKYNGIYTSPIIDMGSGLAWNKIIPVTTTEFLKEIPSINETSVSLATGLVGLYHFNETAFGGYTGANDFNDSSGSGNLGVHVGTVTTGANSSLIRGINLNGGYVNLPPSATVMPANATGMSVSAWIYPANIDSDRRLITFSKNSTSTAFGIAVGKTYGKITGFYQDTTGTLKELVSSSSVSSSQTYHVALTITNNSAVLYINGVNVASATDADVAKNLVFHTYPVRIGAGPTGSLTFTGNVDEVGIWKRALTAAEIKNLYRRAANRVNYQVRSCVDQACNCKAINTGGSAADCDGDGTANALDVSDAYAAAWIGPDGTSGSFYNELQTNTSVDPTTIEPTGTVKSTAPVFDWTNSFYPAASTPSSNRYFQYRILMDSDDNGTACAGAPCVPEISSVEVVPQGTYYAVSSIVNNTALSYNKMMSLVKADTNACTTYQLSTDNGASWKYYDTTAGDWVTTVAGVATSNPLSDYTSTRLQTLASGNFKFKAFLSTNAAHTQSCELNSVTATFLDP